jgi:hypothetical protein
MSAPPLAPHPDLTAPVALEAAGLRARLRRYLVAWLLGAAVLVAPAWPTAAHERSARRPAFERALTWKELIKLRLSPWLLLHDSRQHIERDFPPTHDAV